MLDGIDSNFHLIRLLIYVQFILKLVYIHMKMIERTSLSAFLEHAISRQINRIETKTGKELNRIDFKSIIHFQNYPEFSDSIFFFFSFFGHK